jgi:hypothetical protein
MPTMPECENCLLKGIHSRVKRAYYRVGGKYQEIGWICPTCLSFTLDKLAYREEMLKYFGKFAVLKDDVDNDGIEIVNLKEKKLKGGRGSKSVDI